MIQSSTNKTKGGAAVWSIYQFMARFPDEETASRHVERMRWGDAPVCPHCGDDKVSERKNHKPMPYRCRKCRRHFSVKTGTVFAQSNLPLHKCLLAMHMLTTAKKDIPGTQLARELGVTQKTAWHLAHRIRAMLEQNGDMLAGQIEADEIRIHIGELATRHDHRRHRTERHLDNCIRTTVGKQLPDKKLAN